MGELSGMDNLVNVPNEKNNLDFLKNVIIKNPNRYIEGAVDEVLKSNPHLKLTPEGEDRFIFKILKNLFPTNEAYWNDMELASKVREVIAKRYVTDKAPIKNVPQHNIEEEEETVIISPADGIDRWEKNGDK